jgi:hypothetical protein
MKNIEKNLISKTFLLQRAGEEINLSRFSVFSLFFSKNRRKPIVTDQRSDLKNGVTYLGSSETIRETSFNFIEYDKSKVLHKKKINPLFLEWFIGFSEGDGSFIESKNRLFFIISQKDIKILYYIRQNLGFGKVSLYDGYGRYIVADRKNIDRLIYIFNGNLLLNKTNNRLLNWLNIRNTYSPEGDTKILYKTSKLLQNLDFNNSSWLTGFIDAEGCYSASRKNDKRSKLGFKVSLRFTIDQKDEKECLEKIKSFFGFGYIEKRNTVEGMYRVVFSGRKSLLNCISYLQKYPLQSLKKVSYLRFCSIFYRLLNNKSSILTKKSLKRLERLIKNL